MRVYILSRQKWWSCVDAIITDSNIESLENYRGASYWEPFIATLLVSRMLNQMTEMVEWLSACLHSGPMAMTLSNKWFSNGVIVLSWKTMQTCFWYTLLYRIVCCRCQTLNSFLFISSSFTIYSKFNEHFIIKRHLNLNTWA